MKQERKALKSSLNKILKYRPSKDICSLNKKMSGNLRNLMNSNSKGLKLKLFRIQTTGKYKNLVLDMSTQVTTEVLAMWALSP
jgi:hypothetical protein